MDLKRKSSYRYERLRKVWLYYITFHIKDRISCNIYANFSLIFLDVLWKSYLGELSLVYFLFDGSKIIHMKNIFGIFSFKRTLTKCKKSGWIMGYDKKIQFFMSLNNKSYNLCTYLERKGQGQIYKILFK